MLEEIAIRGLGVIEEAVLEPAPGLTVLTGETGAGKTMVLAGLDLLLGGRADSALVRPGTGLSEVHGRLRVPPDGPLRDALVELGAECEDGTVLLARSVGADGRSRAWLAGRPVPAGVLAGLAELVVAVHGQSSHLRLLRPGEQRQALDRYAGAAVAGPLRDYRRLHTRWRAAVSELDRLGLEAEARGRERDALRAGLAEVEALAPQPGEDSLLRTQLERLDHAEALRAAADGAHLALTGEGGSGPDGGDGADPRSALAGAARLLDGVADHDPALGVLAGRLKELGYQLAEVAGELAGYAASVEADPAALAAGHERAALLAALGRRHGGDLAAALAWAEQAGLRLLELDQDGSRADQLAAEVASLRTELAVVGAALSAARQQAAARFADAVGTELADLAMPGARVGIGVGQRADADGLAVGGRLLAAGPDGLDEVEFTVAAHPGAPARPLGRGASGGELSRIMLAVEVVFAGTDPVPTMIFDEVDAGVGGSAAVEVGRRLAKLARSHQVLCVTHLAQVAAFADRHLQVSKDSTGAVTRSAVRVLEGPERVRELSRMLGGLADSELGQGHAEELLALASTSRR